MIKSLLKTNDDIAPLILRVLLGAVFLPHGAQKVFGWFGGHGFEGTLKVGDFEMHMADAGFRMNG